MPEQQIPTLDELAELDWVAEQMGRSGDPRVARIRNFVQRARSSPQRIREQAARVSLAAEKQAAPESIFQEERIGGLAARAIEGLGRGARALMPRTAGEIAAAAVAGPVGFAAKRLAAEVPESFFEEDRPGGRLARAVEPLAPAVELAQRPIAPLAAAGRHVAPVVAEAAALAGTPARLAAGAILGPEAAERQEAATRAFYRGATEDVFRMAEPLTSPTNLALIAASGGAGPIAQRLMAAGFTALMAKDGVGLIGEAQELEATGDRQGALAKYQDAAGLIAFGLFGAAGTGRPFSPRERVFMAGRESGLPRAAARTQAEALTTSRLYETPGTGIVYSPAMVPTAGRAARPAATMEEMERPLYPIPEPIPEQGTAASLPPRSASEARAPAQEAPASGVAMKLFITAADREQLRRLGYGEREIYQMKPEEAVTILEQVQQAPPGVRGLLPSAQPFIFGAEREPPPGVSVTRTAGPPLFGPQVRTRARETIAAEAAAATVPVKAPWITAKGKVGKRIAELEEQILGAEGVQRVGELRGHARAEGFTPTDYADYLDIEARRIEWRRRMPIVEPEAPRPAEPRTEAIPEPPTVSEAAVTARPVEEVRQPVSPAELSRQRDIKAIREAGGEFVGVQPGIPGSVPDQYLFNDPQTGSTLALPMGELTPAAVRAKIATSRKAYEIAETQAVGTEPAAAVTASAVERRLAQPEARLDFDTWLQQRKNLSREKFQALSEAEQQGIRGDYVRDTAWQLGLPSQATAAGAAPPPTEAYGKRNVVVNEKAAQEAQERIQQFFRAAARGETARMGFDPTVLADFARVGAYHIEAGLRTFGEWSVRMSQDFGERIAPHLEEIWQASLAFGRKRAPTAGTRMPFTTAEAAEKTARVQRMLAELTRPAQIVMEQGEAFIERGAPPRAQREEFYGYQRPSYEATYEARVSVADVDRARNMVHDALATAKQVRSDMYEVGDRAASMAAEIAVGYLNDATKLFKEVRTVGGRVLQASQRPARAAAGLPETRAGEVGRAAEAEVVRFEPGRSPKELIQRLQALIEQAQQQLVGIRRIRERDPITTGLIKSIRKKRWNDAGYYAVKQLQLNLFPVTSWTLDMIGNAAEIGGQVAGAGAHDLVHVLKGQPTFPALSGWMHALQDRWRNRFTPMDAEIEAAFGYTAIGEPLGAQRLLPEAGRGPTSIRQALQRRLTQGPGIFTMRKGSASKALDVGQALPLHAKAAIDTFAKRVTATATVWRDAGMAADKLKLKGAQRQEFYKQFWENVPEATKENAIREGNKAGFNRPLSEIEQKIRRSRAVQLMVDAFPGWGFQYMRWAGEMLGYNRRLVSRLKNRTATLEEFGAYLGKTATGWGGLLLLDMFLFDRTDFSRMEAETDKGDPVRLSGREPAASGLWLLALLKAGKAAGAGDKEELNKNLARVATGMKYISVPGAELVQYPPMGGGLLGGIFTAVGQAMRNPQNDPRALKRELENALNRAVPGQAVLNLIKEVIDPVQREGVGAQLPGVSLLKEPRIKATTGEPWQPRQRIPGTQIEIPALRGTPIPGMVMVVDPVEKLLRRYGRMIPRGLRQPIAGFPPGEVPREYRREWEEEFGKLRYELLLPLAEEMAQGTLPEDEERVNKLISERESLAARQAAAAINEKYGTPGKLPRRPTLRELARPRMYEAEAR